jgi:hypothetical protein
MLAQPHPFPKNLCTSRLHASLRAASSHISSTHKRTEGRAPVRGSEFTTKAAHYRGDLAESLLG